MDNHNCPRLIRLLILLTLLMGYRAFSQTNHILIVRFANPGYDFPTQTYCLDVEFQSDTTNIELYGMNVRFFYADNILEFLSIGDFQGGYGPVNPNPPVITTYSEESGMEMFGFDGPAEFVNGAVKLKYPGNPVYISDTAWTKLFNICFHVDDPLAPYNDDFWPSVIWDLKEDPSGGGFMGGGGVVMTIADPLDPNNSFPSSENVIQYNWHYDGVPGNPFGYPVNITSISTRVAPEIKIDSAISLSNEYVTLAVKAWHFFDISSMTLTLDFNPSVLNYCCTTPDPGIEANFSVIQPSEGKLEFVSTGIVTDFPDGSTLFHLTFKYYQESSRLNWNDNGNSCQFISANTGLPLYDSPAQSFYISGNISNGEYIWSGAISTNWNTGANWQYELVPGQFSDVTINSTPTPANWPAYLGNLTIGKQCKNIRLNGDARLMISGNLAINPGDTLLVDETGQVYVGGNWTNSGTFIPGTGIVKFTGPGPGIMTGGISPENDVAGYVLSTFPGGMTPVTGASPGPSGDNAHSDVNIGFIFKYLGVNYSQLRLNTNGWLCFNLSGDDSSSENNLLLFSTSAPESGIAPWWDDLLADESATISYKKMGSSPNSIFIAEWKHILSYSSEATARLNFQVKLYETSNIIEFCYGDEEPGSNHLSEGASIGIKDATGGPGHFREAGSGTTNLMIGCLRSSQDWPAFNYRFTPHVLNNTEVFYKMTVLPSASLILDRNVMITGQE